MLKKEMYCNLCGNKFDYWDEQEGYSIHKRCGYGSENDGLLIYLDLCCKCMDKLVRQCAITPVEVDLDDTNIEEVFDEY